MSWSPCPFWPGCGAHVEGGCGDCDPEIDEREEAYWENLSEDEWEDYADEDEQQEREGADEHEGSVGMDGGRWVPIGEVVGRIVARVLVKQSSWK